ncbi:MAG TPA: beta-ketoacyl synthase N-terminal-like domain-containing protein [Pseudonocardiaceae bacterium]|nr:beta-ketoacyl synthase N-terminal-like domain-containing protein [Pseudonocardiaceae bacterium]
MRSAVITGVGLAVTGVRGVQDLLSMRSRDSDVPAEPVVLHTRPTRNRDRASGLALRAAGSALRHAGFLGGGSAVRGELAAVVVSTNFTGLDVACACVDEVRSGSIGEYGPAGPPYTTSDVVAHWVAAEYRLRGPSLTLCNGPTSGLDAMYWARCLVETARATVVVVVGVEPDTTVVARLHGIDGVCRWLDGAAAVVVESAEHADRRGFVARAEVAGYWRMAEVADVLRDARSLGPDIGMYLADGQAGLPGAFDLTRRLGRCSGALGVLQCVVGTSWLDQGASGAVLAIAGGTSAEQTCNDAAVGLLLRTPRWSVTGAL